MTANIPAELAQQIGLAEEGDEVTLTVDSVNPDGSVYVSSDHDEGMGDEMEDEELGEGALPPAPAGTGTPPPPMPMPMPPPAETGDEEPIGTSIIISQRKTRRKA